jgi:LacI family transcriptional regulator, gluconate utilization system Gnt-I transcriptional repressor
MRHLADRGHRTVGFIGAALRDNPQAADRRRAYLQAVRDFGLRASDTLVAECAPDIAAGGAALAAIVARHRDATAVFVASELRAIGALLECRRRRWAVPGRMAIAGFNDAGLGEHFVPALTTVRAPREAIGRMAAEMILARLAGSDVEQPVVDVGYEVVVRESA